MNKKFLVSDCWQNKEQSMSETREAIVPKQIADIDSTSLSIDPQALAKRVQERANALAVVKMSVLTITTAPDWQNINGKPYLARTGCDKIIGMLGIVLDPEPVVTKTTNEDGTYIYEYSGWAESSFLNARRRNFIGSRDSGDEFFAGQYRKNGYIDEGDVKKAAKTNWEGNAIRGVAGLGGLTWEEINELRAKKINVDSVDFGKEGKENREARSEASANDIVEKHAQLTKAGRKLGGAEETVIKIESFGVKKNTGGGDWEIRAWAKDADGNTYSTFDPEIAGVMMYCNRENEPMAIAFVRKGEHNNICGACVYSREGNE